MPEIETVTYSPEPSALTRKRIRIEAQAAEREARREKRADWINSNWGQAGLVLTLLVILGVAARLANILGN